MAACVCLETAELLLYGCMRIPGDLLSVHTHYLSSSLPAQNQNGRSCQTKEGVPRRLYSELLQNQGLRVSH